MSKRIQHAFRFLGQNDAIASLLSSIERNAKLLREVRRILPQSLADHCSHAAIEDEVLILLTDSPAWGSRLRFFAPELLRSLHSPNGRATTCSVRIRPPSAPSALTSGAALKARLSDATVKHLLDTAGSVKDEEIAAALRRLAKAGGGDQAETVKGRM